MLHEDKKIVGLMAARNEEKVIVTSLRLLSRYVDSIVFLDDASEDNTIRLVESVAEECKVAKIIRKERWYRDEPGDRNALLREGRKLGGTHFVVLDADEVFTATCLAGNFLRNLIYHLNPGDVLYLVWIVLWKSIYYYRFDQSVWTWNYKPFIFCDDGLCYYESDFIHTPRVPANLRGKAYKLEGYKYGVLHFQFVNWRNSLVKQAWYRCLERIRHPEKPPEEINKYYAVTKDEKDLQLLPAPFEWFGDYGPVDWSVYTLPEDWREKQILSWFQQYGVEYFKDLDIWDIDWKLFETRKVVEEPDRYLEELLTRLKAHGTLVEIDGIVGSLLPGDIALLFKAASEIPLGGRIVEIGSFAGLSAFVLVNGLIASGNWEAKVYCVDVWESSVQVQEYQSLDFVRNNRMFEEFMKNIEKSGIGKFIVPIKKLSVLASHEFSDSSIDLLFIDGDHSFEGVYSDLEAWFPKVRPGGKILGHDCIPGSGARAALEAFARKHGLGFRIYEAPSAHYMFEIVKPVSSSCEEEKNLVSLIILTRNNLEYTKLCLESIRRYTPEPYEIIVVDNGSTDGTVEYLKSQPDVKLIENGWNLGFALGNNRGLREAKGAYIVFLNNDVVVTEGWLTRLLACAQSDPTIGIVGPRSNYVAGVQLVPGVPYGDDLKAMEQFARTWSLEHAGQWEQVPRVIGFCMLVRRGVIERIGGFDPQFGMGNFEDDDFCLRAQIAGFKVYLAHDVFIHHFGSKTFQSEKVDYRKLMERNWEVFKRKWGLPPDAPMERGYFPASLLARPFDRERDFVPLTFPLLPLDNPKEKKYLATFTPEVLRWFLARFTVHDPVTLVLYHPSGEAVADVQRIIEEMGLREEETPDILLYPGELPALKIPELVASADVVLYGDHDTLFLPWAVYLGKSVVKVSGEG